MSSQLCRGKAIAGAYMIYMIDEIKPKERDMLNFAKPRRQKIKWPTTRPEAGLAAAGETEAPDIDLERVIYDPEYRKRVVRRLKSGAGTVKD